MSDVLTIAQLVEGCKERGIRLWLKEVQIGDPAVDHWEKELRCSAVPGSLSPEIVACLKANEPAIVSFLWTEWKEYEEGNRPTYNYNPYTPLSFFDDAELLQTIGNCWMDQTWCYSDIGGETVIVSLTGSPKGISSVDEEAYLRCASYPVAEVEALVRCGVTLDKLPSYHRYRCCLLAVFLRGCTYTRGQGGPLGWNSICDRVAEWMGEPVLLVGTRLDRVLCILADAGFVVESEHGTVRWHQGKYEISPSPPVEEHGDEDDDPFAKLGTTIPLEDSTINTQPTKRRKGIRTQSKVPKTPQGAK